MGAEPSSGVGGLFGRDERTGATIRDHTIVTGYALVIATEWIQRGTQVLLQDSKLGEPGRGTADMGIYDQARTPYSHRVLPLT